MADVGLQEVETYVSLHQNTVTKFITIRHIMDLCLAAEQRPGSRVTKQRWDKDGLDVEGMRMAAWEAERMEGGEETDRTNTETD